MGIYGITDALEFQKLGLLASYKPGRVHKKRIREENERVGNFLAHYSELPCISVFYSPLTGAISFNPYHPDIRWDVIV